MATVESTFHKFRPVCVSVLNQPSVDNLRQLHQLIQSVKKEDIKTLAEYVIFPLRVILVKYNYEGTKFW